MPVIAEASRTTVARGVNAEAVTAYFGFAVLLFGAVLWAFHSPLIEKTDFSVTYIGARIVHEGHGARLYDLSEQQRVRRALVPNSEPLIFEHPPFEALLLSPLAALPYQYAYLLWGCINAIVLISLPLWFRRHVPTTVDNLSYLALWICFAPLAIALYQGQSSLLLTLVYVLAFTQLKRDRDFAAGAILGLGLFKFQFVIPFALIFLFRGKWKFVAGFALSAMALVSLSFTGVGWAGAVGYVRLLSAAAGDPHNVSYGSAVDMATVQGFIHALLGRTVPQTANSLLVALSSAGLIGVTSWSWKQVGEQLDSRFDRMFAVAVAISLVTGFHMFTHDMSPLILAMLLIVTQSSLYTGFSRSILKAALVVFWLPPIYFLLIAWHRMYLLFPVLIAFAGVIMVAELRRGFGEQELGGA